MNFGWTPSQLDGSEYQFTPIQNYNIPEEYSYIDYLPPIEDQGKTNMCVTYSIDCHINWNCNVDNRQENHRNNHVNKKEIYSARKTKGDNGMTFKDALNFCKKTGVNTDLGLQKIEQYMMIKTPLGLKQALLLNGPCIGGLYIKSTNQVEFWNGNNKPLGGHAIAIIGYNKDGFIIRNSWGTSYGNQGYALIKNEDFNKIIECWTIID